MLPAGGARARIVSDNQRQAREEVTAGDISEEFGASVRLLANKSTVLAFLGFQKGPVHSGPELHHKPSALISTLHLDVSS